MILIQLIKKIHHNPARRDNMEHQEVTETIIGCAYRVYNKMGFGFLKSVYKKCLLIELRKAGLNMENL